MTYILAGKFKNESFLMIDTVVDNDVNQVDEKLYKSISDERIYISLIGDRVLMHIIQLYDEWLFRKEETLVVNKAAFETIGESLCHYVNMFNEDKEDSKQVKLSRNRVFVVFGEDINYFDFYFENNELTKIVDFNLSQDSYVIQFDNEEPIAQEDFKSFNFSKSKIYKKSKTHYNINGALINPERYFINGFSYFSTLHETKFVSVNDDFKHYINFTQFSKI